MINGLTHKSFVLSILADGKPHFSREFVQNGEDGLLLEYRKRISELRREGYDIRTLKINGRPGYQLFGKGVLIAELGLFELGGLCSE